MENQKTMLMTPPSVEIMELKNLFIQLCTKTCNLKCKNCYIEKNSFKNEEDFIELDKVKHALINAKNENLSSIYLTGGEPLLHPDFNQILRMCLKLSNVTVLSNGVMINDKKARFLRKIDDESQYETIYRISLDSINELENDSYRSRGSYRKALCAIFSLLKYEFNPIISIVNYKNRPHEEIFKEFSEFFGKKGFEIEDINIKIIPYFPTDDKNEQLDLSQKINYKKLDCSNSRTISQNGVYSCPLLVDDYRARLGSTLDDCAKIAYLECEKCSICTKFNQKVFVNDWM